MPQPMKLGILISGGGTTFLNLHHTIHAGKLNASIACVISSTRKAAGVEKARELGYPTFILSRKKFSEDQAYSKAISACLFEHEVELVVLAGFLKKYIPQSPYENRCINIHPSLIPAFCGHGFYGMRVHQAVWERSCKISGCTVHLVNANYDEGPIIVQKAVTISDRDSPETIQKKVFELECQALPEAIGYFVQDRITFENGRSIIHPVS